MTSPPLRAQVVHREGQSAVAVQLLVAVPLTYLAGCAYFALFKLGNFSFYRIVPHYTDAFSLLLNASLLARFAAPLCYNFLYCLRMQDSVSSFAYSSIPSADISLRSSVKIDPHVTPAAGQHFPPEDGSRPAEHFGFRKPLQHVRLRC